MSIPDPKPLSLILSLSLNLNPRGSLKQRNLTTLAREGTRYPGKTAVQVATISTSPCSPSREFPFETYVQTETQVRKCGVWQLGVLSQSKINRNQKTCRKETRRMNISSLVW